MIKPQGMKLGGHVALTEKREIYTEFCLKGKRSQGELISNRNTIGLLKMHFEVTEWEV
jgi:hypothetical protein